MWWSLLFACRAEAPPSQVDTAAPTEVAGLSFDGPVPTRLLGISWDTTRRDHLGRYAGDDTTPFLDQLLSEGVVLDDHRSCSNWTAPSVLCATTGAEPWALGFWPGTGDDQVPGTPRGLQTVAGGLLAKGYDTTLVTANRVFSDDLMTAQGFDTVITRDYEPADVVADIARQRLGTLQEGDRPWYVHLHFMDPHRPYCPPPAYREGLAELPVIGVDVCEELEVGTARWPEEDEAWRSALLDRVDVVYRGELRYLDDTVAGLWADLDAMGALDDTLVVFFTDHGEQHMERGVIDHGFELFGEENRAAAAFWARNLAPRAVSLPTLHTDLAATLAALHDLPLEATGLPLDQIPEDRVRRLFAYSRVDHGDPQLTVVQGELTRHREAGAFDLGDDPGELRPLGNDDLEEPLAEFVAEIEATWPHLE